jgi:alkylation response protein AidB-like acyl-CoA dehydrogenase
MTITGTPAAAAALGPEITARAAEIEHARRLPSDLVDSLSAAGCFGVLLPGTHGGTGADLPSALDVFSTLARADASVGWTVMIGACGWCELAALPRASFDDLFRDRGKTVIAGAFSPSGSITPSGSGYRVSGRWAFASGCEHARWLWGNCLEDSSGAAPRMRAAVFPADQVIIEDTWHVSGLAGTGSHHFRVEDRFVPAERTFAPLVDPPCLDSPILRVPTPAVFALSIAAVAVGAAQGALDDLLVLARDKTPFLAREPLVADQLFQHELATADTALCAARALLGENAAAAWARAVEDVPATPAERARLRAAATWATERASAVVDTAYRAGGGTAVYLSCPLQRRLRDVHAMTQHFLVRHDTFSAAGALLTGQEIALPVF